MVKQTFIIRKLEDAGKVAACIRQNIEHAPLEVTVHAESSRSAKQNRLYWLWVTEIGESKGYTKDEIHAILKRDYAVPIFTRDNNDYAALIGSINVIRELDMADKAEDMERAVVELTSTTHFTVEQFREYLNDIEKFAIGEGITLTIPEELR